MPSHLSARAVAIRLLLRWVCSWGTEAKAQDIRYRKMGGQKVDYSGRLSLFSGPPSVYCILCWTWWFSISWREKPTVGYSAHSQTAMQNRFLCPFRWKEIPPTPVSGPVYSKMTKSLCRSCSVCKFKIYQWNTGILVIFLIKNHAKMKSAHIKTAFRQMRENSHHTRKILCIVRNTFLTGEGGCTVHTQRYLMQVVNMFLNKRWQSWVSDLLELVFLIWVDISDKKALLFYLSWILFF